jgi:hypothetical protein
MTTYNLTAILKDGRTVTGRVEGFRESMAEVARWHRSSLFTLHNPIQRVFLGHDGGDGVMEFTVREVLEEAGR